MTGNHKLKPVRDDFLVFGSPLIGEDEINDVLDTLRSGWIGTGPKVARFETAFAEYKQVSRDNVSAVNSCTAALHVSLIAAGLGPGDEVITTPLTFCATVNAIIHSGATPVLADVDPVTMNIDPEKIKAAITPKTRAILPVHFAGRPCCMDDILDIAKRHDLKVIEDCAHAVEAEYRGNKTGTMGDFGCFSFYVTKNIVTGEGGMVLARRNTDTARIRTLALHGMNKDAWKRFSDEGYKHYQVTECGFKYNMMDLQAAIGLHQLERVETSWQRRQQIWNTYMQELGELQLILPAEPERQTKHGYHLFTLLVDADKQSCTRDKFLERMTAQNIGIGVHYLSIPEHPYYRDRFNWQPEDYPHAMRIGRQTVSLPLSGHLSDQDVNDVIIAVKNSLMA